MRNPIRTAAAVVPAAFLMLAPGLLAAPAAMADATARACVVEEDFPTGGVGTDVSDTREYPSLDGAVEGGLPLPPAFLQIPPEEIFFSAVVGDWDGDGVDTPAYRVWGTNTFLLARTLDAGNDPADWIRVDYGKPDSAVFAGDWDGDGTDTFALRHEGTNTFHFRNDLAGGTASFTTDYGRPWDQVVVGTFREGGHDTLSVRRGNSFLLKYDFSGGPADIRTDYGTPDDWNFVIGDWDGDGVDSPTIRRDNIFHIKNTFTGGPADRTAVVGDFVHESYALRLPDADRDVIVTLTGVGLC